MFETMSAAVGGSFFKDMEPATVAPEPEVAEEDHTPVAVDDIEIPAFMRRERRLYQ
jgi:hypothetical protein